jgi:putative sigma-54 modulation protein
MEEKEQPQPENETIRVKNVELMAMSIDEAITQMELLDHKFYLFKNEENNRISVVYKRDNGGYGLLEPNE